MEEPCQDTKILFRSDNYPASTSSTKSRSKILRYSHTNDITPLNTRESVSSISVKCLRKKLPFSEFQLYKTELFVSALILILFRLCQHLPSKSFTSSLIFKSTLYDQPCDTILLFGGLNTNAKSVSHDDGRRGMVYQYIPSKNRWTFVSLMPNYRQHHSAVIFQGRIYIAGGTVVSQMRKVSLRLFHFYQIIL